MLAMLSRAGWRFVALLGLTLDGPDRDTGNVGPAPLVVCGEWFATSQPCHEPEQIGGCHRCTVRVMPNHRHLSGGQGHICVCGETRPTDQQLDRIARWVNAHPREYDACLWPDHDPCPKHDLLLPWPAGRDCTGTCTNCNAPNGFEHEPSCSYNGGTGRWARGLDALWRKANQ